MANIDFVGTGEFAAALANGRRLLDSDPRAAGAQAQEILRLSPESVDALELLAQALHRMGRTADAGRVEAHAKRLAERDQLIEDARQAMASGDLGAAEQRLRPHLERFPEDPAALTMLAEIGYRLSADHEAEALLRRAIKAAPGFLDARSALARVLVAQNRIADAVETLDVILHLAPENVSARHLKANLLARLGDYPEAITQHELLIKAVGHDPRIWLSFGDLLKTVGRTADSVAAYRRAVELQPGFGEAWWSLANLKTAKLHPDDIAQMEAALADKGLGDDARLHLHFALGKALEDAGCFADAFRHYEEGNRLRRALVPHDRAKVTDEVGRSKALFTPAFFAERTDSANDIRDPIFIVGMPRSGSTLIEQILASHSMVEGTSELPYMLSLTHQLGQQSGQPGNAYPEVLGRLSRDELDALGQAYLDAARSHRKTNRPLFIDKMPNNWLHLGIIHLLFPKAAIIDARREPLACCFSNFKQHFAHGQTFAYALDDLGRYYADYIEMLRHFDEVLPGRIHRVVHERLIDDPEGEIRRLLEYVGLPFEEACLRFHENARPVRTPSAEQVRRPINREGMDQWKPFEPWLDPLKRALGPVLDSYPDAPPSDG